VALMFVARSLHRKHHFDLAHHVTWGNDWMPSGLFVLPTPFIWGPIGGSSNQIPRQIDLNLPAYARRHDRVRSRLQRLLVAADPLVALTRARAKRILAYSKDVRAGIPSKHRGKVEFSTGTLAVACMSVIIGTQLVAFAFFTKVLPSGKGCYPRIRNSRRSLRLSPWRKGSVLGWPSRLWGWDCCSTGCGLGSGPITVCCRMGTTCGGCFRP